jgi:DNA modification methylase
MSPFMELYHGSCLAELAHIASASVDSVITDPPYGFDPLDSDGNESAAGDWDLKDPRRDMVDKDGLGTSIENRHSQRMANGVNYKVDDARHTPDTWGVHPVVGGYALEKGLIALPRYMLPIKALFNYQLWCAMWASECLRILKPGGHLLAFNGSRTYHRMACGIEDAGFECRDTMHWTYGRGKPSGTRPWQAMDRMDGFARAPKSTDWEKAKKQPEKRFNVEQAQSENGIKWEGWHTGLKPSHELIGVFRKPFKGPVHRNMLLHGTGAYNVDACAIPIPGGNAERWPANTILTHSPWCGFTPGDCADDCPVALLEHQHPGAGAYFGVTRWEQGEHEPFTYVNKPHNKERHGTMDAGQSNDHPTVKPVAMLEALVRLVTPPGGRVADPFAGSGTTGLACIRRGYFPILVERDAAHLPTIRQRCGNTQLPLFTTL